MKCVKRLTAAQQRLVEENLPIVERVLRFDIQANPCVSGLGHEDLYQEGCVWLCNAALTFDPARGSFAAVESQYAGVTRRGVHALAVQVSGMPLTAVAVRMSAPPNHVSAWISRAAHKLRNNESFLSSLHEN